MRILPTSRMGQTLARVRPRREDHTRLAVGSAHSCTGVLTPGGDVDPLTFDVVIEIPAGSRNKYEVDHHSGKIRLDRRARDERDAVARLHGAPHRFLQPQLERRREIAKPYAHRS